jgi:hypothetical protein
VDEQKVETASGDDLCVSNDRVAGSNRQNEDSGRVRNEMASGVLTLIAVKDTQ